MDIHEQLPVLLKVEFDDNFLKLRLDENGLGSFNSDEKSIQEITLSNCRIENELNNCLQELITEVFEYEVFEQEDKTVFQFWGDYGRITDEIECKSFTEKFSGYTQTDLIQKGTALYDLYVDLYKRFSHNFAINNQLKEKLSFEITNEIERSQRKAKFFEEKDKSKSEALQSEIKFLRKTQRLVTGNL